MLPGCTDDPDEIVAIVRAACRETDPDMDVEIDPPVMPPTPAGRAAVALARCCAEAKEPVRQIIARLASLAMIPGWPRCGNHRHARASRRRGDSCMSTSERLRGR